MILYRLRSRRPGTLSEPPSLWQWLENAYDSRMQAEAARRDVFRSHGGQLEVVVIEQAAPVRERTGPSPVIEAQAQPRVLMKRASAGE